MRPRKGLRTIAVIAVIVVTGAFAAATAAAAPPAGVSMEGTGPQPAGLGLFSKAALDQDTCNPETGQTSAAFQGSGGAWCVNPWADGKKNGGATAQGVDATSVRILVYIPNDQMIAANTSPKPTDNATGAQVTPQKAVEDYQRAYDYAVEHLGTYQLWGRHPELELFTASGPDEAAQRADAVAVIAKKPFMVLDTTSTTTGAPVFASAVAAKKIIVGSASTDAENGDAQAPYRWNTSNDPSSTPVVTAAFVGKTLSGKKAQWAGDPSLAGATRTFGAVYPVNGTVDIDDFETQLTKNGGKLTEKLGYDPTTAIAGSAELGTLVNKLKSSGITSVVLFASRDVVKSVMALATTQDYFPEWVYTGTGFQEFAGVARTNDPQQMAHAFGLAQLGPFLTNDPRVTLPAWYYGPKSGSTWSGAATSVDFTYNALHYAGPTLTAANVQKGLFSAPSQVVARVPNIGKIGFGKTVGTPYNAVGPSGSDRALVWWDPDTEGPAIGVPTPAKGVWEFLNNGENVSYTAFTKTMPKFFDKASSIFTRNALDFYPDNKAPTPSACPGCPSQGGTTATP